MKINRRPGAREAIKAAVVALDGEQGKVGWFESAKHPDGTPVAGIAAVQEFGSRNIPPRSFFRTTAAEQQTAWASTAAKISKAVMQGKMPAGVLTEALCLAAEGDVRAKITKITAPPLSVLTLLARKHRKAGGKVTGKTLGALAKQANKGPPDVSGVSTKPLVDTGLMLATLTSQVIKK